MAGIQIKEIILFRIKIIATGFKFKYSLDLGVRELIKAYKMLPEKIFRIYNLK